MQNASSGTTTDFSRFISDSGDNTHSLMLQVEGMHCASCAWRIESTLNAMPDVNARVNFSTERLKIDWKGAKERANEFAKAVAGLGFRVAPFSTAEKTAHVKEEEKFLLRCLAVAGFASGNIMLFSLALWFSHGGDMGEGTRTLMHWMMALIALPAIIYSGRPFFYSAWAVLKNRHANMDVPISLAVILASVMSLHETVRHGPYVYFDASVMLLFFLLIGRYLDKKTRGRAREAAEGLLAMLEGTATIVKDGKSQSIAIRDIRPGMRLLVAAGEKIAADGYVTQGSTEVDTSLVTGETLPRAAVIGEKLYAGMINLAAPIEINVAAASDKSLLADIVSLLEKAEQGQARYVRLADRVAELYTPVVHVLALATFMGWLAVGHVWQEALLAATAVLIITCPCALGLAVPVVQVLTSGQLFKRGMLLKSGDALEKLAGVDTIVLDKTGTLTLGTPKLTNASALDKDTLQLAASLAAHSRHPLAKAVAAAWPGDLLALDVQEIPAHGLEAQHQGATVRLGKRSWCGDNTALQDAQMELWLDYNGARTRFTFADILRSDAAATIRTLQQSGYHTVLLSGDRLPVVTQIAEEAGITDYRGEVTPVEKSRIIEEHIAAGHKVLMVGDGLNDAPALAAASVSMSPSSAVDITQNAADIVFRGEKLEPVLFAITTAKRANRRVQQNFALSLTYNLVAVPLAVFGLVTPLIAAIAMSGSSLIVIGNSLRP